MKKLKIVGVVLVLGILIGLLIFAIFHPYGDSHLRIEGVRVRLPENTLIVDGCNFVNLAKCEKIIKVGGKDQRLVFEYKNFKKNGYPLTAVATINGKEFYREDGLNIEVNSYLDYKTFLNFYVMNEEYILFTLTKGSIGRTTTLYAIDLEGNVILEEHDLDADDMLIKDTVDFVTYKDNTVTLYGSRMSGSITYNNDTICNAKDKEIVEAYYTYTLKDGKFSKKQTKTTTAKQYIKDNKITCEED